MSSFAFHSLCAALLVTMAFASPVMEKPFSQDFVDAINAQQSSWRAEVPDKFADASLEAVSKLCGTILPHEPAYHKVEARTYNHIPNSAIPDSFDARQAWPKCTVIQHISDQSSCGSCWAVSSTNSFNDRLCIASNGTFNQLLSFEDTTACCTFLNGCFSMGCNGGQPSGAWGWFKREGVVSGGDYSDIGKDDTCRPYSLAPCAHHVTSPKYPACPDHEYSTPKCQHACSNTGYKTAFMDDRHHAKSSFSLGSVEDIQKSIMSEGSVTAAFSVYSDFPTYKSGVYHHTSGSMLGGHAVRMIGWGVENGDAYWLIANSWNDSWGDNGTFKIARGKDECGIESGVVAGTA